jgi:hypothetical protein
MASVATGVIDFAASRLLRVQAKFGIRLAPLHVASGNDTED